jgi:hypothetical protein
MHQDEEILDPDNLIKLLAWKTKYNENNAVRIQTSAASNAAFGARISRSDEDVKVWDALLNNWSYQLGGFDADLRTMPVMKVMKLPDCYLTKDGKFVAFCEVKGVKLGNFGIKEEDYNGYKTVRHETGEMLFVLFYCKDTHEMWVCNIDDYDTKLTKKMPTGEVKSYVYFKSKMTPQEFIKTVQNML